MLKPFGSIRATRSPMRSCPLHGDNSPLPGWVALKPTKPTPRRGMQRRPPCRSRPISPLGTKRSALYCVTPDFDFAAAEAEFRKAEKLAPADAGPKFALSFLFATQGRLAEAENIMRQTLPLDPLGVTRYLNLARILIAGGRYDEAEAALRKAIELQPAAARLHAYLTMLDVLRGNAAAALRDAELEPKGFWRDYALALAQQVQSDRATADAALQKLINEDAVSGPFQIAAVYGLRKEPDKMFEWLERAYIEHDPGLTQLLGTSVHSELQG